MSTMKSFSVLFVYLLFMISSNQAQSYNIAEYRRQARDQHNVYRAECGAAPLQQNTTLDAIAQQWCEELVSKDKFIHSGATEYGENSFKKTPFDFVNDNGATPVKTWFGDKSNRTHPEDNLHFSQVVWKNTKSLGLGVCSLPNNGLLFVANYYPRGNYKDQFAQNVGC